MKSFWAFLSAACLVHAASAQAPVPEPVPSTLSFADAPAPDRFAGNHRFDNFIGFLSNPLFNVDPRSMTAIWPLYGYNHASGAPALPSSDLNLLGAGLTVALSERLAIGLNDGGYAFVDIERGSGPFRDRFGRLRDRREFAGQREGWMNLGGFAQYTFLENADEQFLATAGLRWIAPTGSSAIFQGNPPVRLAPYATIAKGWGDVHLLATAGYQFPAGSSSSSSEFFYAGVHLDRQFGWFYPLVEFNFVYHTSNVDIDLPTRDGFVDFGGFSSSGNLVSLAAGANAVLIPSRLELGAAYVTSIAAQRDFSFDGLIAKVVLRY